MSAGITPGEWLGQNTSSGQGLVYSVDTGKTIAVCYNPRDTRAIAAVPDLIDCARGLIDEIDRCGVRVSPELEAKARELVARADKEGL